MTKTGLLFAGALAAGMACTAHAAPAELPPAVTVDGYFQEIALDGPGSGPAIVAVDDDDRVWVALAKAGKLAMYSGGQVRTFDLGQDSRPVGVIAGTRANGYAGSLWVAASYDNKILRFDWQTGKKTEYPIPGKESWPFNIALDGQGRVWFTQRAAGALGWLDPASGKITQVALPRPNTGPAGLGIDTRSGKVWFTQSYADSIASYDPATGQVAEYPMGTASTGLISGPAGLAVDASGGVWFAKLEGKLGHLAPGSREISLVPTPAGALRPAGLTLDTQGNVWLGALDGNSLVRYQPVTRQFTVYPLPVGGVDALPSAPPAARTSRPFGLAFDRRGNLWFTQQYTGQLGVLDLAQPELQLFSPGPEVRIPDPYVTLRALDTVSGIARQRIELDGQEVRLSGGRLDLSRVAPGEHVLKVVAVDHAGHATEQRRAFRYAPTADALPAIVRNLQFKQSGREQLRDTLVMTAQEQRNPRRLDDLKGLLDTHRGEFADGEYSTVAATVDWIARTEGQEQRVAILDRAPYFQPQMVHLRAGGSITWHYQGEQQGHEISHELHQIEVAALGVKSPLLRAGDRYVQRFAQPGDYTVVDARRPGSALRVVVTP